MPVSDDDPPSDDSPEYSDPVDSDIEEVQSDSASGYEPENESECTVTACASDIEEEVLLQPNQPRLKSFPTKKFGKNKVEYRSFNSKWFDNEKWSSWLHWDSGTKKAYCFICRNIYLLNKLTFSECVQRIPSFHLGLACGRMSPRHLKSIERVPAIRKLY